MSPVRAARRLLLLVGPLLGLGAGCASMDAALNAESGAQFDTGATDALVDLRLDVYPSDATPDLLPQSLLLEPDGDWTGLEVEVSPSVEVSGRVVGFVATPFFGEPEVPGEADSVVPAQVAVLQEDSVAGGSVQTDGAGTFSLRVPTGDDYRVEVIPEEPTLLPFAVLRIPRLAADLSLGDLTLDYGAPVWGQVLREDGSAPAGATARLVDVETDVAGPRVELDDGGWYLLRATVGDYELEIAGREEGSDPTVRVPLAVLDDEGERVDANLGPAERLLVEGRLTDESGDGRGSAEGYLVRLTAIDLRDIDGSLVVNPPLNDVGDFLVRLMPGTWRLEAIPPYNSGLSPAEATFEVGDDDVDLGNIVLSDKLWWSTLVVDRNGAAAADTLVSARELNFDGNTWSATTASDGRVELELPQVPLELTLTPPNDQHAITRYLIEPGSERDDLPVVELVDGLPVEGMLVVGDDPVPFALVEVRDADGRLYGSAITDGDGAYSMRVQAAPSVVQ